MTKLEALDPTNIGLQKQCPQCSRLSDRGARICVCGFWFVEQTEQLQVTALRQVHRHRRTKTLKKVAALGGFIVAFLGAVAYLGGFIDLTEGAAAEQETNLISNVRSEVPSAAPKSAFPKNTFEGTVSKVVSGDTITVVDKYKQEYTIRLSGIDAPEPSQFFGEEALRNLSNLALDRSVLVVTQKIEENGAVIGKVIVHGQNLSLEQLRAGFAAHTQIAANDQTDEDRLVYSDAEKLARNGGFGIWSSSNPDPQIAAVPLVEPEIPGTPDQLRTLHGVTTLPQPGDITVQSPENAAVVSHNTPPQPVEAPKVDPKPEPKPPTDRSVAASTVTAEPKTPVSSPIAKCADGTLYYGSGRRGACSGRGGVADWLGGGTAAPAKTAAAQRKYMLGPRGGCYYVTASGSKSYVDKSLCN